jgi:hypothetical protein
VHTRHLHRFLRFAVQPEAGGTPPAPPAAPAPPPSSPAAPAPPAAPAGDDEPLGPAGVQALERMKEERRTLKEALKPWADLGVSPDEVKQLLSTREGEAERQKQRELEQAAIGRANERLVTAEVRAAAKGVLADPADAMRFLDLSKVEVGDDGTVDTTAIETAIADLVKSKPYLAAQGGSWGSADAGARTPDAVAQITREQLKTMTPEQIDQARIEGRLAKLLGG